MKGTILFCDQKKLEAVSFDNANNIKPYSKMTGFS